jgi:hypothetical protein
MSEATREILVNPTMIVLVDSDKTQAVVKTPIFVKRMLTVNAFFSTELIYPGLRYLSADYVVDKKTCFDVIFEVPPGQFTHDGKPYFTPWITFAMTVAATTEGYKKPHIVAGSCHVFINETQIWNQLTEVKVPTFVTGIDEQGRINNPEFYADLSKLKSPVTSEALFNAMLEAFALPSSIDPTHPDLIKFAEVQTKNGYTPSMTVKQARESDFSFDFSFLPSFEIEYIVNHFGVNTLEVQEVNSLFDFFKRYAS